MMCTLVLDFWQFINALDGIPVYTKCLRDSLIQRYKIGEMGLYSASMGIIRLEIFQTVEICIN